MLMFESISMGRDERPLMVNHDILSPGQGPLPGGPHGGLSHEIGRNPAMRRMTGNGCGAIWRRTRFLLIFSAQVPAWSIRSRRTGPPSPRRRRPFPHCRYRGCGPRSPTTCCSVATKAALVSSGIWMLLSGTACIFTRKEPHLVHIPPADGAAAHGDALEALPRHGHDHPAGLPDPLAGEGPLAHGKASMGGL